MTSGFLDKLILCPDDLFITLSHVSAFLELYIYIFQSIWAFHLM